MTEKEKMIQGQLYSASDPQLRKEFTEAKRQIRLFNRTTEEQLDQRLDILRNLLGKVGKNPYIEPPFRCDYGYNIFIGDSFYANYDCIILDVCPVHIGHHVMFGPRISIYTATHPMNVKERQSNLEYGKPIHIGNHVWIGGDTVVNPGVHIGDNTVIGSGSVVAKDIPANVFAAGNPCRVIKEINK